MAIKIVSGGQTGVDRAALDAALEFGIDCGGWCPRGRRAEDGPIPDRYPLRETPSPRYIDRTRRNVTDSDGTLVLTRGPASGGTAATIRLARRAGRPLLVVDMEKTAPDTAASQVADWLSGENIRTLNIAGPRDDGSGSVYAGARALLDTTFVLLSKAP